MSFHFKRTGVSNAPKGKGRSVRDVSPETLHRMECRACPLNSAAVNSPKIEPVGHDKAGGLYILGQYPSASDDRNDAPLTGRVGSFLRRSIPDEWERLARYNNVIRTRPPERDPSWIEIECCRPSIVRDIEQYKPVAIIGLGFIPLNWMVGDNSITNWRGRRVPVKVGNHTCWFFPVYDPEDVIKRGESSFKGLEKSDHTLVFRRDLKKVFRYLKNPDTPYVEDVKVINDNIEIIDGSRGDSDLGRVRDFLTWAKKQPDVAVDIETNGLRPYKAGAKILSFSTGTYERTMAFAVEHRSSRWSKSQLQKVHGLIKDFLLDAKGIKVVQNLAFEMEWAAIFYGKDVLRSGRWDDTQSQAYVLDERKGMHNLDVLCQIHFGFNLKQHNHLNVKDLDSEPLDAVLLYNGRDVKYTHWLWEVQKDLIDEEGLTSIASDQVRRIPTIVLTQTKGLPVNQKEVARCKGQLQGEIDEILSDIKNLDIVKRFEKDQRRPFEPTSVTKDCMIVFKDYLKRSEIYKKDKNGKVLGASLDEEVLKTIDHPLAALLIKLRGPLKLKSTYVDVLELGGESSFVYPDGRCHPQFNTAFTNTGRLSSEDPNIQNQPKNKGKYVRKQFIPPKGHRIVSIDYGQIEARLIAMASKDEFLVQALWNDYDIHMEWAERLATEYPTIIGGKKFMGDKDVMKGLRQKVKNKLVFPAFFGAHENSIAGYLDIPEKVSRVIFKDFWKIFYSVKSWQDELLDFYAANGYIETLTGRRRHAPMSPNQVINMPVQGTASDIVIDAMNRISEYADAENLMHLHPVKNIHDDLTFHLPDDDTLEDNVELLVEFMLDVPYKWVNVPISVEGEDGLNWYEMESFGSFRSDEFL